MRGFVLKILLFVTLFSFTVAGVYLSAYFLLNSRKWYFLTLDKNVTTLFAGDSNIACAVNDSVISNSANVAFNGESYLYTYIKLKNLLELNPQLKTVVINCSPVNLHQSAQDSLMFRDQEIYQKIEAFGFVMQIPEMKIIFTQRPLAYITATRMSINSNFYRWFETFSPHSDNFRDYNFGGYFFLTHDKLKEDKKKFLSKKYPFKKADIQIEYLEKISSLCRSRGIKLILLNTPKHPFYMKHIDAEMNAFWHTYIKDISSDSVWDYSSYNLPDSCFGDLGHLNYMGARQFSEHIHTKLLRQ